MVKFFKEVKSELRKVVFPTWREASIMVLVVSVVSGVFGLFFLLVDGGMNRLVKFLLGL